MANLTTYADSRFGVEKILIPPVRISTLTASGTSSYTYYCSTDTVITELGLMVSTALSAIGISYNLQIRRSTNAAVHATCKAYTGAAVGKIFNSSILTGAAGCASSTVVVPQGDWLLFVTNLSCGGGAVVPYVKYREAFVTP